MNLLITGSIHYNDFQHVEKLVLNLMAEYKTATFTIISRSQKKGMDVIGNQIASKYNLRYLVYFNDDIKTAKESEYAIIADVNDDQYDLLNQLAKNKVPYHLIIRKKA